MKDCAEVPGGFEPPMEVLQTATTLSPTSVPRAIVETICGLTRSLSPVVCLSDTYRESRGEEMGSQLGSDERVAGLPHRFRKRVSVNTATGCWNWIGNRNSKGYGRYGVDGRTVRAHRFAYATLVGEIPPGFDLDHFKMNPGPRHGRCSRDCVNPEHLEPVPHGENVRRGNVGRRNRDKAQCRNGHPFDDANTYINGGRHCRTCRRERKRTTRSRRKAQRAERPDQEGGES